MEYQDWMVALMFLVGRGIDLGTDQWPSLAGGGVGYVATRYGSRFLWAMLAGMVRGLWWTVKWPFADLPCFRKVELSRGCQAALDALADPDAIIGQEMKDGKVKPGAPLELLAGKVKVEFGIDLHTIRAITVDGIDLLEVLESREQTLVVAAARKRLAEARERDRRNTVDLVAEKIALGQLLAPNVLGSRVNQSNNKPQSQRA